MVRDIGGGGKKPRSNLEKKAKRSERNGGKYSIVLLGRSVVDNRRQSSFTAVIGLAYSDAKCSCICMTQSRLSASPCATENREKRTCTELGLTQRGGGKRERERDRKRGYKSETMQRRKRKKSSPIFNNHIAIITIKTVKTRDRYSSSSSPSRRRNERNENFLLRREFRGPFFRARKRGAVER